MKRIISAIVCVLFLLPLLNINTFAEVLEYSFGENTESADYIASLPDEAKENLKEDIADYGFSYFYNLIKDAFKKAETPALKTFSSLCSLIIAVSLFNLLRRSFNTEKLDKAFSLLASLTVSLSIWNVFSSMTETAKILLESLNNMMLLSVPMMEGVLISSGNITSATVMGTGVNLMITLGEGLFAKVLFPGAVISFFLSVASAVSENEGIVFISKMLKGLITGALLLIMALLSFVIILQNTAASAADTFAARTVKFAISSYLPIVGGTVSESFSCLASSMAVIKSTCGITGVVATLVLCLPSLILLICQRISLWAAECFAGMLGCPKVKMLLGEAGGVGTLLIAVCSGAVCIFIIALGVFCKTVPSMG